VPTETDEGVTAFAFNNNQAAKDLVITSEEAKSGDGTVTRFLAGETGTVVSMYFSGGENPPFPQIFVMSNEENNDVFGFFSPYDAETETFSLTLRAGPETHTLNNIVLNKNVLSAYQPDPQKSGGWNARMRDYTVSLGVWTALTLAIEAEKDGIAATDGNDRAGLDRPDWYLVGAVAKEAQKAVDDIVTVGKAVAEFFAGTFMAAAVQAKGAAVGVAVSAPVTIAIAAVVVTVAYLSDTGNEEPEYQPDPPPAELNAPHFYFYYLDESGEQIDLPVMSSGETPALSQAVYIPPNGHGQDYTSNVRFYYKAARSPEAASATDVPTVDFAVVNWESEANLFYQRIVPGKDEQGDYIEIKKGDGALGQTMPRRHTRLIVKVYDGSGGNKSPYPVFYANGMKFTNADMFVINFFDYVTAEEKEKVVIPPHEVIQTAEGPSLLPHFPRIEDKFFPLYTSEELKSFVTQNLGAS
jgi:hypothetical protein